MNHATHHAIAPGLFYRQARQRHQPVHEIRMGFAPHPRLHPAQRSAHHQTQVILDSRATTIKEKY